jgi:hypothetical protein
MARETALEGDGGRTLISFNSTREVFAYAESVAIQKIHPPFARRDG